MAYYEETSPTRTDVYDILASNEYIQWSNVTPKLKERLIHNAMDDLGPGFGSWRGFYTFFLNDLVNHIKVRIPNQMVVSEGRGC